MMTTRAKVITVIAGAIGAVAAMIVSVSAAWALLDSGMRAYVLAQVEPMAREQREHREVLFDIRRGQLDREIFALEQLPTRTTSEEFRLRQLRDELKKLEVKR